MDNQNGNDWLKIGTVRCGLLLALCGMVLALLLIVLGFWNTLLVAVLAAVGYWIGAFDNKSAMVKNTINRLFPPKGE